MHQPSWTVEWFDLPCKWNIELRLIFKKATIKGYYKECSFNKEYLWAITLTKREHCKSQQANTNSNHCTYATSISKMASNTNNTCPNSENLSPRLLMNANSNDRYFKPLLTIIINLTNSQQDCLLKRYKNHNKLIYGFSNFGQWELLI